MGGPPFEPSGIAQPISAPTAACARALSNIAYSVLGTNGLPSASAPWSAGFRLMSLSYWITGMIPAKRCPMPRPTEGPLTTAPIRVWSAGNTFFTSPRSTASELCEIEIVMSFETGLGSTSWRFQGTL